MTTAASIGRPQGGDLYRQLRRIELSIFIRNGKEDMWTLHELTYYCEVALSNPAY